MVLIGFGFIVGVLMLFVCVGFVCFSLVTAWGGLHCKFGLVIVVLFF